MHLQSAHIAIASPPASRISWQTCNVLQENTVGLVSQTYYIVQSGYQRTGYCKDMICTHLLCRLLHGCNSFIIIFSLPARFNSCAIHLPIPLDAPVIRHMVASSSDFVSSAAARVVYLGARIVTVGYTTFYNTCCRYHGTCNDDVELHVDRCYFRLLCLLLNCNVTSICFYGIMRSAALLCAQHI